jgi:hypothetical protein
VRILVLGDSLASNLGVGLTAWARATGDKAVVWNLGLYGCGLFLQPGADERGDFESHLCLNWRGFWAANIERFDPDVVVIASGVSDLLPRPAGASNVLRPGDREFDRDLLSVYRSAVDVASARGARVVRVNTPCAGTDAEGRLRGVLTAVDTATIGYLNRTLLPALAASRPALAVFDLFGVVCPGGRFVRSLDGITTARTDALHLSTETARNVARQIVAQTFPIVGGVDLAGPSRGEHAQRDLPVRAKR